MCTGAIVDATTADDGNVVVLGEVLAEMQMLGDVSRVDEMAIGHACWGTER